MKKILLFLGFLVFYPSAFAAVHSVENISEKVKGDRLSLSDVNSILGTIRGFFFDDSTGFVGVGTDSPAANLEISSGTDDEGDAVLRIEADKNNDNEQDNSWIDFFQDGGKNGMKLGFTGNADNDFVFIPTSDSTQASTPALTVQLDGKIGIGTTSPSTKFEILGDGLAGIFGVQPINDGGSSAIVSTNHNLYLVSDSNSSGELGDIIFARGDDADTTALTELLRVDYDGNVGIGTESPKYLLDLSHTAPYISFTDTNDFADRDDRFFIRAAGDGSGGGRMYFGHYDHSEASEKYLISMDESGDLGIGTSSPSTKLHISSAEDYPLTIDSGDVNHGTTGIQFNTDGVGTQLGYLYFSHLDTESSGGDASFHTSSNQPVTNFIHHGGDFYVPDGNVGIGTTNPEAKLEVAGKINVHTNDAYIDYFDTEGSNVDARRARVGVWANRFTFQKRNDDATNYADLFSILLGSGNVGIGTTSPEANLEISSGNDGDAVLRIESDENNNSQHEDYNPSIEFFQDGGSHGMKMGLTENAGGTYNSFAFFVTSGGVESTTPALVIEQDGDLQIQGTATAAGTTLTSDARLKNNIKPLPSSLEKVLNLRGISYEWKAQNETSKQIGVVAQEVEAVYPELVHTSESGYKSVSYSKLVAPLIEAVKEIFSITESNADRIAGLEAQIEALRLELDK